MSHFDDYYSWVIKALFIKDNVFKVKITCRCAAQFLAQIPRELMNGGAIPILACPKCNNEFIIYNDELMLLKDFKTVEGQVIPKHIRHKPVQPTSKAEN